MATHDRATTLRPAAPGDAPAVAAIWFAGWRDGHLGNVPDELTRIRTEESFGERAAQHVDDTVVAEVGGRVAGFVMVAGSEVEQVYVDEGHRGSGVASLLLDEAERLVAGSGHPVAWLAVVEGNLRARRFYERQGWSNEGLIGHAAPGNDGPVVVPALRYTKQVRF
jgi:ribosomal protein S18 acetylase RimI-like enzyme